MLRRIRIANVPVRYLPRTRHTDGKKLGLRDGWQALVFLLRRRGYSSRRPVRSTGCPVSKERLAPMPGRIAYTPSR